MPARMPLERDEDARRTLAVRRPEPPAPAPARMLALQRSAGNRAVAALIARDPTAQTPPVTKSVAQAIADEDTDAIAAMPDFSSASDAQRFQLIDILNDQFFVGPGDEAALERIWASFGERLPELMATHARQWADSVDNGAKLQRWTRWDNLGLTCEISPGVINDRQVARAVAAIGHLSDPDYLQFRQLMHYAGSGAELAFLCKALAAERSMAEIAAFAGAIRGKDRAWLLANLNVADETTAQGASTMGIQQQWQMSCGPTTVQTLHAQNDPIYALELTSGGPVVGQNMANFWMTVEQGMTLLGHGSTPTPIGTSGQGAWVESDLNALSKATGVTYAYTAVTAVQPTNPANGDVDKAVTSIAGFLGQGIQIPLVIGGSPGATSHYVMALRAENDSILVHDPGNGITMWVTRAQFLSNSLSPPLSWAFLAGYDRPQ
jgi:hypothetical protein